MKKIFLFALLLIINNIANHIAAQNVGIGTATPNASAQLDVSSTTKGMLAPRMTTAQRTAIASPAAGLLVFDNSTNSFWFYTGSAWTEVVSGAGSSKWNLNGTNIYNNNAGNVGIGTDAPMNKLQIVGNMAATAPIIVTSTPPTALQTKTMADHTLLNFLAGDSTGRIYDPGGPAGNYPAGVMGDVNIPAAAGCVGIELTAETMELATGDSLIIKETSSLSTLLVAVGNGYTVTGKWVFNSPSLFITFKSNGDAGTGIGFSLLFKRLYDNSASLPDAAGITGNAFLFEAKNGTLRSGVMNNAARGKYSTAFGSNVVASGDYSIAVGFGNSSTGLFSASFGIGNIANGVTALATGLSTTASGNYSTAMGKYTDATGYAATATGDSTIASGRFSFASGFLSTASGDYSAAIGNQANAGGLSCIAMGSAASATGLYCTAIGFGANASGHRAVALGNSSSTGQVSTSMGLSTIASGDYSTAMGRLTNASGVASFTMGQNTTANGNYSTAIGKYTDAIGYAATAIGDSSLASGPISFASGFRTTASGNYSTAMGYGSIANGNYSTAMGNGTTASDTYSTAMGFNTTASGINATSMGANTTASGNYSTVMGLYTTASGDYSTAMGKYVSTNNQEGCFTVGDNSTTTIMNSPAPNNFRARFANGYRLYTSADYTTSCSLGAGDNAWTTGSDVRTKENFAEINGEDFLNKISGFHLTSWNYKTQNPKTFRHYGPMAQDFYAAFGKDKYGTIGNDTTINSADFAGVSFIAIQALEKRTQAIEELKKKNEELEKMMLELRKEMDELKKKVK